MNDARSCERCGKHFHRPPRLSATQWENRRFCSKRCAPMKRHGKDPEICALYISGKSSTEVAALLGISTGQVYRALRDSNVDVRSASEGKRLSHSRPETKAKLRAANLGRPCSGSAKNKLRLLTGEKNHGFKSGLTMSASGYISFTASPANGRNAGRLLHQLIGEFVAGRPLRDNEVVHHKDHNKLNNHPDNLQIMTNTEHGRIHSLEYWRKKKNV